MLVRSTGAVCVLLCAIALTACGGDDGAGGTSGSSGAGTGGDSGAAGTAGTGGTGGTAGNGGTGGTAGTAGTAGTGGDDSDSGMTDLDAGVDAALTPVECEAGEQDNDEDGVCAPDCTSLACVNGTCADTTGTALCDCDTLYEGDLCDTLVPPPQEGLVLWLDAQNDETLELVGDGVTKRVASWHSVLDDNVAFVQDSVTGQPGRPNNGINGRPAVNFDGTSDFLALEDFAGLNGSESYDIYFIATSTNEVESGAILAGVNGETGTAGAGLHGLLIEANDTATGLRFNHRMPFAASGGVDLVTANPVDLTSSLPYRFHASAPNGRILISRDTTQLGVELGDVIAFNRDLDLTIGRLSATQNLRRFKGRIGEVLVYSASQDSFTAARIRNYLKAHWPIIQ